MKMICPNCGNEPLNDLADCPCRGSTLNGNAPQQSPPNTSIRGNSQVLSTVLFVLVIILLAASPILLKQYVLESRVISSESMVPTLQVQDRILINKLAYRFANPQRGDIVVFSLPDKPYQEYVKRLIGLPGETVKITGGRVYINGVPLQEPYIKEPPKYEYGPVRVPDNAVFVLGDNRNMSLDSHMWNTWLTLDKIHGRAVYIFWPTERRQALVNPVTGRKAGL